MARPSPRLAPVTTTTRSVSRNRSVTDIAASPPDQCGDPGSCRRLLQNVHSACRAEPDDVGQADLGPLDLATLRFTAQVMADPPDVRDAGGPDRVALRLESAG